MQGEMAIMDRTGDTKLMWDSNNADEVATAKDTFKALKKKGFIAYKVNTSGDKGEIINDFDALAGKIILSPPLVGG